MKNILLALASFLMVSVLLLQVALAEEVDEYGYAIRTSANPPLAGENRADEIKDPGNPKKTEGNAFVLGGDECTDCALHVWNKHLNRQDTKFIPRSGDTDVEGKTSNPRNRR